MDSLKSVLLGVAIAVGSVLCGFATKAEAEVVTLKKETMSFDKCLLLTQRTITSLGVPANRVIPIVNTGALQITKIVGDDGNYLFTCSKADRKLLLTHSTPPDWHLVR